MGGVGRQRPRSCPTSADRALLRACIRRRSRTGIGGRAPVDRLRKLGYGHRGGSRERWRRAERRGGDARSRARAAALSAQRLLSERKCVARSARAVSRRSCDSRPRASRPGLPSAGCVSRASALARFSAAYDRGSRTFRHAPVTCRRIGGRHRRHASLAEVRPAMSLRVRINLIITALVVLFTLVMGDIIVNDMRNSIREEMEAGGKITLQLMRAVLYGSAIASAERRDHVLLGFLQNLGRVRAHEIRLYDLQGKQIYVSPPPVYKAGRSAPDWFTRLVSPQLGEMTLQTPEGQVVVVPDASRATLDAWDDLVRLIGLLLGLLVVVNVVVFFLLGRSLRPVQTILAGLSEMKRGRFDVRLPAFKLPEFDSISRTFNAMAQELEESHAENRRLALVARQASDAIIIHDLQ